MNAGIEDTFVSFKKNSAHKMSGNSLDDYNSEDNKT